jgi:hypothetical protein
MAHISRRSRKGPRSLPRRPSSAPARRPSSFRHVRAAATPPGTPPPTQGGGLPLLSLDGSDHAAGTTCCCCYSPTLRLHRSMSVSTLAAAGSPPSTRCGACAETRR